MALGKKTAVTETPPVIALYGGVFRIGSDRHVVHEGDRLRADHPLVKAKPALFAADGLTEREMEAARQAYRQTKPQPREEPRRPSPYAGWKAQEPLIRVDPR